MGGLSWPAPFVRPKRRVQRGVVGVHMSGGASPQQGPGAVSQQGPGALTRWGSRELSMESLQKMQIIKHFKHAFTKVEIVCTPKQSTCKIESVFC